MEHGQLRERTRTNLFSTSATICDPANVRKETPPNGFKKRFAATLSSQDSSEVPQYLELKKNGLQLHDGDVTLQLHELMLHSTVTVSKQGW